MRLIVIALVAPLALVLAGMPFAMNKWKASAGPRSIAEVVTLAEKNGLYCTFIPAESADTKRVIVSYMPLDEDEAALVNLSFPSPGVASCYVAWESVRVHYNPNNSAFWGDIFVHGDPDVVKILTGANPDDQ